MSVYEGMNLNGNLVFSETARNRSIRLAYMAKAKQTLRLKEAALKNRVKSIKLLSVLDTDTDDFLDRAGW